MNKIFFIFLFIVFASDQCTVNRSKQDNSLDDGNRVEVTTSANPHSLGQIQGVWRSFSYCTEHDGTNVDDHINEYYRLIRNNQCLDIIFKSKNVDSLILDSYQIGFINDSTEISDQIKVMNEGAYFVRNRNGEWELSTNFLCTFDVYDLFEDGFTYSCSGTKSSENVQFKRENSLPADVFKLMKNLSDSGQTNYLHEFEIKELSQQAKIKKSGAVLYRDANLSDKSGSILQKKEIVYVENYTDTSVKIYREGSEIFSGYVSTNGIELLR